MNKTDVIEYSGTLQDQIPTQSNPVSSLPITITHASTNPNSPLVAVLLCTHEGDRFLAEQLDSIDNQGHRNVNFWVSDDGSKDDTSKILEKYQSSRKNRFSIRSGPRQGYVANYLSLIHHSDIKGDYFAYSDQDDIWQPEKLSRAIAMLESVPNDVPALYCSRTCLINESGQKIGSSPLFEKPASFANALVQNIGGGNTMVMNKKARDILIAAGDKFVVSHDWWTYMLISGAGGTVIYDSHPGVLYRQHANNLVGSNNDWQARLHRIRMLLKGRFRNWNTVNTQALQQSRHLLTPENLSILDEFCKARNRWLIPRIVGTIHSGIYRQTFLGNLGLMAAVVLKKF